MDKNISNGRSQRRDDAMSNTHKIDSSDEEIDVLQKNTEFRTTRVHLMIQKLKLHFENEILEVQKKQTKVFYN